MEKQLKGLLEKELTTKLLCEEQVMLSSVILASRFHLPWGTCGGQCIVLLRTPYIMWYYTVYGVLRAGGVGEPHLEQGPSTQGARYTEARKRESGAVQRYALVALRRGHRPFCN